MSLIRTNFLTFAAAGIILLTASNAVTVAQPPAGGPPPGASGPPPGDPLAPDLFIAIRENNIEQVKTLLDKGAKIESTNWLGLTPLLWAAMKGNEQICTVLLDRKANIHGESAFGGVLEAGEWAGNPRLIQLLIDRGAKFTKNRGDMITAVMTAAEAGHVANLKIFLALKPDVNVKDLAGMSALMHASRRGQAETAKMLLAAGANVNDADNSGRTPLMHAAMNGYPEIIKPLLSKGAAVNAKDKSGNTALMLAAKYNGDAEVASLLTKAGATKTAKDAQNRTATDIALAHGYTACATSIEPGLKPIAPNEESLTDRARKAATLSLSLIEKTTKNFSSKTGCASCHHQGVGLMTTGVAKAYGFVIDAELEKSEQKIVLNEPQAHIEDLRKVLPHPEMYKHFPGVDMNEFSPQAGMTLGALIDHETPRNEAIEAMATILARQQMEDGSWGFGFAREPMQSSPFTFTAYAVRVLKAYLPESMAKERDERIAKAIAWMIATPAKSNEDRTFLLLGLKWAGAPEAEVAKAVAQLRKAQHKDGGWGQFDDAKIAGIGYTRSDAYATGQALYALYIGGGVKTADPAYRNGVEYLLRTQDDDGAWFVNKRAVPANNYLDTGFPYGQSQYVSYAATSWSSMALMFASKE